jgi:hypothetical protein
MDLSQVPIVGRPAFRAHHAYVMATFTCGCRPENQPQLIRGLDAPVVCLACQNVYAITNVQYVPSLMKEALVEILPIGKVEGVTP